MRIKTFAILFATALVASVSAADKDVEDLLSHMRSAYHAVSGVTFTAESRFMGEQDGKESTTTFINAFSYKSPSKIRLDITSPGFTDPKFTLVKISDGDSISMKLPNETTFTKQPFSIDNFEANLPANLESFCFWDADRQLSTQTGKNMEHSSLKVVKDEEWNGKKWTVLEETATEQKVFCRYFVDPKTFFIWRVTIRAIGAQKDVQDSQVTKLDVSTPVLDSVFKLPGG